MVKHYRYLGLGITLAAVALAGAYWALGDGVDNDRAKRYTTSVTLQFLYPDSDEPQSLSERETRVKVWAQGRHLTVACTPVDGGEATDVARNGRAAMQPIASVRQRGKTTTIVMNQATPLRADLEGYEWARGRVLDGQVCGERPTAFLLSATVRSEPTVEMSEVLGFSCGDAFVVTRSCRSEASLSLRGDRPDASE